MTHIEAKSKRDIYISHVNPIISILTLKCEWIKIQSKGRDH